MPHFYVYLRYQDRLCRDEEGDVLPDLGAVRAHALAALLLIMVVDHSWEAAAMVGEALQDSGHRVMVAHIAEEALERFDEARATGDEFRLVFSDVIMPGGANGVVLAEQVDRRDPDVPVLLTTGNNDEIALHEPQAIAMNVLGEPLRRGELIDRVQATLRRGARTGSGRERSDFGPAGA